MSAHTPGLKLQHDLAHAIIADRQHACLMVALRRGRGAQEAIVAALVAGHNRRRAQAEPAHTIQGWAAVAVRS